ncbi:MAG: LPS-assembly protein LptD, partial [Flavobacteriaceae bacterium]|nr:LPS-assembly protein LptD [Bacteroidia bacterium]NNL60284.1 LPS-assembly protein LptD [Flavobacteriaceae bacterium]
MNTFGYAQDIPKTGLTVPPDQVKDTIAVPMVKVAELPINEKVQDTVKQDSVIPEQEFLTGKVDYKATDYVTINQKEEKIYLYNEAQIIYEDMQINAGIIVIDYNKNEVYAGRIKDSLGNFSQLPIFKQGTQVVEPDSIRFNFDTEKALVFNSRTEQSGFNIIGDITKKENDSVVFMSGGRFTTSDNLEDPEYYFQARKIKFVPKKKIVTGLTNMVIADVPTPIGLPFAFFPLTEKQTSGVILPSFGEQNNRGYFLQNGGYYFAISDYFDLAVLGDYYTNGSYALRSETNYAVRYKFRGNLSLRYEKNLNSERGFPDFSESSIYNIRWSHAQDTKSNPNSRFSAAVNLGSSQYYQQSINQLNVQNRYNNTLSSSISYSKTFRGEPQVNMSLTATHTQNSNTDEINMTLPTLQGSVSRMFPFAPKTGSKKGILQNINLQYNLRGENRINTTEEDFFTKEMFDNAISGFQHSVPISTNFKVLKYLSLTAGTNFQETWVFNTIDRFYDSTENEVVTESKKGFEAFRTYNFSTSLGTTLYGMFDFGKDKKIQAIRHVIRPSISYNINPAFDQFYDTYEVIDADGTTREEQFTKFEGSLFGTPSDRYSSTMGISVGNNIEAKVKAKDSTETEPRKITIFNNLNFSSAYNFAADSLRWSPMQVNGGTQLLNGKMSINFNATLDPYALDNNNRRIDEFNINNGGSLFRLTGANVTMNYSFDNESFSGDTRQDSRSQQESIRSGGRADDLFGKAQDFADSRFNDDEDDDDKEEKPTQLYNYKIPWNVRLAYSTTYSNSRRENEISSHSLMFSSNVELSPRWSLGLSSGWDLKNKGVTPTQLRLERDLLSWRMNFSYNIPSGQARNNTT